jgi:copper oxidase (laccase) domain-containing protein
MCYEVGSEVVQALQGTAAAPDPLRPAHVDLREVLLRQAARLGVGEVTVSPACSAHDRDLFFSHRASGGRDGRMVAYLGAPGRTA